MPSDKEIWASALSEELAFWDAWFRTKGLQWPEDYRQRLNPDAPLPEYLASLLPPGAASVRILDVGAGPITKLGTKCPGRTLQIVAVDPLAAEYNRILDAYGIVPRVRTEPCEGEQLTKMFPRDSFDIAHAQNCLDHSYNPLAAIREMIAVVKPGGCVRLEHAANEGETQKYQGLHQWNFDGRDGHFIAWNSRQTSDITEAVQDVAVTQCWAENQWCSVLMRKIVR